MLHNFGGNIEMYGALDSISSGPVDARVSKNSTMVTHNYDIHNMFHIFYLMSIGETIFSA
jgi:hypothetical protein